VAVTEELRRTLYHRALGRCECMSESCSHHVGRCNAVLRRDWHAHHRTPDGPDELSNLVAMCSTCYENARAEREACLHAAQGS
jgi:hypothetical protein